MKSNTKEVRRKIASNLRKFRLKTGLTQLELANQINLKLGTNLKNNTISSWESATNSIDMVYIPVIAEALEETGNFEDKLTIAKFALAYAIKNDLDTNLTEDRIGDIGGTKWNIGSVDTDQYLRNVIISLYPDVKTPYRTIEILMNKGLTSIGEIIDSEGIGKISDYM